jgi:hypothetical protein
MNPLSRDQLKKFLKQQASYVYDINKWAYEMLKFDPDVWQKQAFNNVAGKSFCAWSTGTGVGKTAALAIIILHHLVTHPFPKIPCTAPTQHQLFDALWAEISKWMRRSELLMNALKWTQTKVALRGHEEEWFAVARSSRPKPGEISAEGLQGFHSQNLLFVVDEASAVPDPIFDAVDGAFTTSGAKAVLAGNPTRKSGYFYKVITDPRIGAIFSIIFVDARTARYVTPESIDRIKILYGEESDTYRIKVLGLPPFAESASLFTSEQLLAAHARILSEDELGCADVIMSCDPARFGDDYTLIYVRKGNRIIERRPLKGMDTVAVARLLKTLFDHYRPKYILVDVIGIGAGVVDSLKDILANSATEEFNNADRVVEINSSASPVDGEMFRNIRAEMFWHLHSRINDISIPHETAWLDEELPHFKYFYEKKGLIQIIEKKEIKSIIGRSPGDADALALAYYNEVCTLPLVVSPTYFKIGRRDGPEPIGAVGVHGGVVGAQRYSEFGSTRLSRFG